MKIIIAPDSFKESLTAAEVATAIREGMEEILTDAEFIELPLADGGEGSMDALVNAVNGRYETVTVTGPHGTPVEARFGLINDDRVAVIEMAEASGLQHMQLSQRNPQKTTSRGVGELIFEALSWNVEEIILTLGGSATNDGGLGMAQALGVKALEASGKSIAPGGEGLLQLASLDIQEVDYRISNTRFRVICDVDNPLAGPDGATLVFGLQKGGTPQMLAALDDGMAHYGTILEAITGRSLADVPGAGAAGGMGVAACGFLGAGLEPGINVVMEAVGLREQLKTADLVITGEGRIDEQTSRGKTIAGVAREAAKSGLPVIAFAGSLGAYHQSVFEIGVTAVFSTTQAPASLKTALKQAKGNLRNTARNVAALYRL